MSSFDAGKILSAWWGAMSDAQRVDLIIRVGELGRDLVDRFVISDEELLARLRGINISNTDDAIARGRLAKQAPGDQRDPGDEG